MPPDNATISAATFDRVERAAGAMATAAIAQMDATLPWFRSLPADHRSSVMLVAQAGIAGYVPWASHDAGRTSLVEYVFGTAPRQLARVVTLRRTVELVRAAMAIADAQIPELGADEDEQRALRESLLRYSREIAFAAAAVYATAAERRGAWDERMEAALVDGIVRGENAEALASRAASLSWDPAAPVRAVVGTTPATDPHAALAAATEWSAMRRCPMLAGVHELRLVLILAGADAPTVQAAELFAPGAVVCGPRLAGLAGAVASCAEALAGLRAARAWPEAPRPVDADDLLTERVLDGDLQAADRIRQTVYTPLLAAAPVFVETLDAYLTHTAGLESAARALYVHPNTVRYRLRRVAELTGRDPWNARDQQVLRLALILGRLAT